MLTHNRPDGISHVYAICTPNRVTYSRTYIVTDPCPYTISIGSSNTAPIDISLILSFLHFLPSYLRLARPPQCTSCVLPI